MSMEHIEQLAKEHAAARSVLRDRVQALTDELQDAKRRKLPGIRSAVAAAQATKDELETVLKDSQDLFVKPKTRIFHGIKVGFTKGKGIVSWADAVKVVELIKKHLADRADVLIKTKETPIKKAIANLQVADLKRIGCSVTDAGDEVVVAPTDGEIDKLVDALLETKKDGAEDSE